MAYREKIAWLTLVAMALCYAPYFWITAINPPAVAGTVEGLSQVWLFAAAAGGHAVIVGLGQFLIGKRQKADERDRDIERRSMQSGYWFLLVAMMLVGVVLPLIDSGWNVANAALLSIVVAEMLRCGVELWNYRRGLA